MLKSTSLMTYLGSEIKTIEDKHGQLEVLMVEVTLAPRPLQEESDFDPQAWDYHLSMMKTIYQIYNRPPRRMDYRLRGCVRSINGDLERARRQYYPTKLTEHCMRLYVVYEADDKIRTTEVFVGYPAYDCHELPKSKAEWIAIAHRTVRWELWPHFPHLALNDIKIHGVTPIGSVPFWWELKDDHKLYTTTG